MLEFFTCIGLGVVTFIGVFGITALCGWMANDDDYTYRWILSSVIAAGLATALIMTNIH